MRDSIRKIKGKDQLGKRSESERKISVGLKLQKIDSAKNIAKEPTAQVKEVPELE